MSIKSVKFSGIFKILLVFILLSFVGGSKIYAQYYPVHATVQWPSPQSPYLSDYYSGSRDRLIVTLLNRDLQQPLLFAKLRIKIKSPGFLASSREEVNYPILELNANVPTRLTNIDLAPYLQPQNLQTNGALRNGQLPVGYTEFSVQVVDYYTGRVLSDWHTGRSYLDVKKPPLLNYPEKDAQIGITEPLYIRFQWMPRHQGLAGTEYEFVLKELPDNGAAPQSAFAYGNEIYRIHTRNTTLNYTHLEPILFPNRRYAWQVQAIARDGVDEIGMFENGGFSEIGWFYLTDNCQAPTGLKARTRFAKADLSWNKVIGGAGYVVECRPKTKLNVYEWSNTRVAGEILTLAGLKPGWTYEWRVGTLCIGDRPVFSDVHEFTLSSQNDELLADCGKEPVRNDLSQEPNLTVRAGDVITIGGDYPMTITEAVSLGDGWYAGRGKTRLKTIIDAPVSLRFDRLRINVDNFQIDGTVEASYDENKAKIADLDYVDDGGKDIKPATIRMREHKTDFTLPDIPQFSYNPKTGELETTDADGNPQTIKMDVPENASYESIFPMLVTDNKGNTYQISTAEQNAEKRTDNEGEKEHKNEKIALNCERVDRVGDFNTESLSSKYDYIHFERGESKYAFDDGKEEWYKKSVKTDRFYKPFTKGYIAPWKLVPSGENDIVMAKYDGLKNIDLNKVRFVSEPNSAALPAKLNETEMTWTISLRSVSPGTSYDVYALYEGEVIGKLRVVSYDKQLHKVTLVPINEVKLDKVAIEQELNTIYNPVGIQFTVDVDESMRGNYDWEVDSEKDSLLSTAGKSFLGYDKELKESTEMLNLQKAYQQVAGTLDGAYLFVLNGATGLEGQKDGLLGEMPRKSRFGYIFAGNSPNTETLSHTIAHELGHGIFTLQHTFDYEYAGKKSQGKTRNLMDYDPKGKEIAAFQWNIMAKPAVFTAMDKEDVSNLKNTTDDLLALEKLEEELRKKGPGYIGIRLRCESYSSMMTHKKYSVEIPHRNYASYIVAHSKTYVYGILALDGTNSKVDALTIHESKETIKRINQTKADLLLIHFNEDSKLQYCDANIQNYPNICMQEDFTKMTKYLDQFKKDIASCIESGNSHPGVKDIHQSLREAKAIFGQGVEFAIGGKIYQLSVQDKLKEVQNPLRDDQINKGQWEGAEEERFRFTFNDEGILKVQAFGINSKLKTAKEKKANLVDIAKNFRNKTNDYLEKYAVKDFEKSPSSDNIDFNQNETLYADGDKVSIDNNAPYLRLVAEGWHITKQFLKTGTVSENVYLDKTRNQVVLHAPGLVTGIIEVVAQKVTDLTSLGTLVYDIATSEETRSNLALQFKNIKDEIGEDPKAFFPIFRDVVLTVTTGNTPEEWDKSINSKDSGERSHLATRGTGNAILTMMSGAAIVKNLPEIADKLGNAIKKVKRISQTLEDFIAKSLPEKLEDIENIWKTKYPVPDMLEGRSLFEDIMGEYRYRKADGWAHTADIAENFKGVDFYKDFVEDGNDIFAQTAVSMKTTMMTDAKAWLNSKPIQGNIKNLKDGLKNDI